MGSRRGQARRAQAKENLAALLVIGSSCALLSTAASPAAKSEPESFWADGLNPRRHLDIAKRYTIDSAHTVVSFNVRSFGIFKQHGRFGKSIGSLSLDPRVDEWTFEVVIDARSLQADSGTTLRIMRGSGFLNVERFPEISYKAARVIFNRGEPTRIQGELTLLGVTQPILLSVSGYHCTSPADQALRRCAMDATATFKRTEFGMTGSMPLAADRVKLAIHAEATADPFDNDEEAH